MMQIKPRLAIFSFLVVGILLLSAYLYRIDFWGSGTSPEFDGDKAYADVEYQLSLGPRTPGSDAHSQLIRWVQSELTAAGWEVTIQETTYDGQPIQNIIAKRGEGTPWIILGAHYDSRIWADQDPDTSKHLTGVPGANDGASGVAVLLELARNLPLDLDKQVWLVFFDNEDNGDILGYDWILGSRAFVEQLSGKPDQVVIIDMIGDKDLNIYMERNSNPEITESIWKMAGQLGYSDQFISSYKFSMIDDHTPFLEAGIPAIDIIDFDYPYWHTTADTADKVSSGSLKAVGETLLYWLIQPEN